MLTQITNGLEFGDESPHYIPVNDYVRNAIQQTTSWLFEGRPSIAFHVVFTYRFLVSNVPDAETHYHAHEFLDATVQPKSIFISPNEVYGMHALLSQKQDELVRIMHRRLVGDSHSDDSHSYRLLVVRTYCASSCKSWTVFHTSATTSSTTRVTQPSSCS